MQLNHEYIYMGIMIIKGNYLKKNKLIRVSAPFSSKFLKHSSMQQSICLSICYNLLK